jgi:hypothetical protein
MNQLSKIALTVFIWLSTIVSFLATLAIAADILQGAIIPIVVFLFGAAIVINGFIWQWGQQEKSSDAEAEKRKRERIDTMIRNMSDEDLMRLKRRLGESDFDDAVGLDEDGELVYGKRK